MKIKLFLLSLSFMAFATFSYAQTATPGVSKTQIKQSKRIKQGVANGELTLRETGKLARQQAYIQHAKRHAKSDGVVTRGERFKLNRMQSRASKNIYRQKHDRQDRKRF